MTQNNPTGDLGVAARKLDEFGRRLDKVASSARRRTLIVLLLSLAIAALVGFNLLRAYRELSQYTPNTLANLAQDKVQTFLDQSQPQIEQQIADNAPKVVDELEKRVADAPNFFAEQLKAQTQANMEKHMPELEKEIVASIRTAMESAKSKVQEYPGANDQEKARNFLNDLGKIYGDQLTGAVDQFRAKYAAGAEDIIAHLDHLATNQGLSVEEQHQREAIRKFLALAEHFQENSGKIDNTRMGIHSDQADLPGTK